MPAETWNRLRGLFESALELELDERRAFIDRACGDDEGMRAAVLSLLDADENAGGFLDQPMVARRPASPMVNRKSESRSGLPAEPKRSETPAAPRDREVEENRVGENRVGENRVGENRVEEGLGDPLRLGPYRIVRRIGQGGMGVVYLAVRADSSFNRRVVVKLVRRDLDDRDLLRRLRTERQILAALDHPNIARLIDGGATEDSRPYFIMEYVDGRPIDRYCDEQRLDVTARLELFVKICSAVQYAHQNLVVHRDLKPSNILVTAAGEPKLLDFGIAKLLNPDLVAGDGLEPTATWHRLLTPQYASPEQVRGKLVTTASDVYSLGVLLFKLLTGLHPHRLERRSAAEIERILTEQEAPKPSTLAIAADDQTPDTTAIERARSRNMAPAELARHLQGDLDAIVAKALRPAPLQRYASPERLAEDIERFRRGLPVEARQGTFRYRAGRAIRRHRWGLAAGLLLSVLIGYFVWSAWRQAAEVRVERDLAQQERRQKDTVMDVLLDLLKVADPFAESGKDLTVREALENSREPLHRRLREEPALLAEVLQTTGVVHANLGLWQRARVDLEEALELRRSLLGEEHPDTATTRSALGIVLAELGEQESSLELTRQALFTQRAQLAASVDSIRADVEGEMLRGLHHHVTALCIAGLYEEAAPLAQEAVALARARPSTDVEDLASALFNEGSVALRTGREAAAAESFRQSIGLLELLYGKQHLQLATPLNNLGSALRRSGDSEAAEAAFNRSISIIRTTVGGTHSSLAPALNNVANLRLAKGDAEGAIELWREVKDLVGRQAGVQHPRMLYMDLQIARARISIGEEEPVLGEFSRVLPVWQERLGSEHQFLLQARCLEAEALSSLGRLEAAASQLEAALEVLRSSEFLMDLAAAETQMEDLNRRRAALRDSGLE